MTHCFASLHPILSHTGGTAIHQQIRDGWVSLKRINGQRDGPNGLETYQRTRRLLLAMRFPAATAVKSI
jgi:hypothetical protein